MVQPKLIQEMIDLQKKAGSYDMLLEEFNSINTRINEAIEILTSITGRKLKKVGGSNKYSSGYIAEQFYNKLKSEDGLQVTKKLILDFYSAKGIEIKEMSVNNALVKLKTLKGVQLTKEGRNVRYFYVQPKEDNPDRIRFEKTSVMG